MTSPRKKPKTIAQENGGRGSNHTGLAASHASVPMRSVTCIGAKATAETCAIATRPHHACGIAIVGSSSCHVKRTKQSDMR